MLQYVDMLVLSNSKGGMLSTLVSLPRASCCLLVLIGIRLVANPTVTLVSAPVEHQVFLSDGQSLLTVSYQSSEAFASAVLEISTDNGVNWLPYDTQTGGLALETKQFVRTVTAFGLQSFPSSYCKIRVKVTGLISTEQVPNVGMSISSPVFTIASNIGRRLVIITHGFQATGTPDDWPEQMALKTIERAGGAGKIIRIKHDGAEASVIVGTDPASQLHPNGVTVICYDWARVSNNLDGAIDLLDGDNSPAIPGWREAAGDLLANYLLGSGLVQAANQAGRNLDGSAIVPIHFIGHSFGTVVTSEAIKRLATNGITVDQMTTLDPHDIDQREVADAENDPPVTVWSNVTFADNYWQDNVGTSNDPSDGGNEALPVGHELANAYNWDLTEETSNLLGRIEFPYSPHSRVWAWYFKTVTGTDANDDVRELSQPVTGWYEHRDPLEFGYKLTAPSNRPAELINKGVSPTAPPSIFNGDFELSISNRRGATPLIFSEWPGFAESRRMNVSPDWELFKDSASEHGHVGWLKSDDDRRELLHQPIWISPGAEHLELDVNFLQYTADGKLKISLLNADNGQGAPLQTPWESGVTEEQNVWRTIQVPLDASTTRGRWAWLKIEVDSEVGIGETEVYIDNLRLVQPLPIFTGFRLNGMPSANLPGLLVYLPATGDITLSVEATGGAVYQWFRKAAGTGTFVTLVNDGYFNGATSDQLTIKNPTTAYNGDEYRVEVRNSGGTATSNSITLTLGSDQMGDLIGDYRFEGNTNDFSGHGATGTAFGGVTYGAGMSGRAVELNGTNGFIDLPNVILRPMTASAWVKLDSDAVFGQVSSDPSIQSVAVIDGWKDRENFMLRIRKDSAGNLRAMASFHDWVGPNDEASIESYDEQHIQSARTLKFGEWYHLAMTYDGVTLKLYVDGRLEASAPRPTNKYAAYTAAVPDLRVGIHRFNDGFFKGAIDDVRLYATALDAGAILAMGESNLLGNGSFEDQGGIFFQVGPGNNALAPWVVTAGNIDLTTGWPAAHGERLVDMDGFYQVGTIAQAFQAESGENYLLSFAMSGNDGTNTPKQVEINVGDQTQTFTYEHSAVWGWERRFLAFQATGTNQTLTIRSLSSSNSTFGAMLDDLAITKLTPVDLVAPTITTQPTAVIASDNTTFTLSVVPVSVLPVYYQWRRDGIPISGANGVELTLSNLDPANHGVYDVVVTNAAGSTTSETVSRFLPAASLTLQANPAYGGSVTGAGTYLIDTPQVISATPITAWFFAGWSDGSMDNPRHVTVPAEGAVYTANFSVIAPTANGASGITPTSFQANWGRLSGITALRLDVAADAEFSNFVAGYHNREVDGNAGNESVAGLSPGTTYYYRVRTAYLPNGPFSANSTIIAVTTTIPSAPVPFAQAASNVTLTGFQANWAGVSGVQGLRLDVATDGAFSNFVAGYNNRDINGNAINESVTGLNPGTTYFYRLRSYILGGTTSDNSSVVTVTTSFNAQQLWQQDKFTATELADTSVSGPAADPDSDGLTNLIEYALGLEPKADDATGQPEMGTNATDWIYTYTRPVDRSDVTCAVEFSTDLVNWSPTGVTHELVSSTGGTETWRGRYALASATNAFFRLKVALASGETGYASPHGGMTLTVPANQTRSFALPVWHERAGAGRQIGRIGAVGTNYADVTNAGWAAGGLSNPANPYYLRVLTGNSAGRALPVSTTANTDTRVFLTNDGVGLDLGGITVGAGGDGYELVLADTLASLFGSTTLLGGTDATRADNVQTWTGASWLVFYYNTVRNRWERNTDTAASPSRDNFVLRPDRGIMIARRAATDLKFHLTGRVPTIAARHYHARPGTSFLSNGLPKDITLAALGLETRVNGWIAGTSPTTAAGSADLLQVWSGASWLTFYYDSTNGRWQREGEVAQTNRDTFVIPAGRPIMIRRVGGTGPATESLIPFPLNYTITR